MDETFPRDISSNDIAGLSNPDPTPSAPVPNEPVQPAPLSQQPPQRQPMVTPRTIPPLEPTQRQPSFDSVAPPSPLHTPRHPQSRKKLVLATVAVIVLAALGGGYYAYSKGYIAIPYLTPSSKSLFQKMVDSLDDLKNAQYAVGLTLGVSDRDPKTQELLKNTNGDAGSALNPLGLGGAGILDSMFPVDLSADALLTFFTEIDKPAKDANAFVKLAGSYKTGDSTNAFDFELRKKGDTLYGVINKFPGIIFFDLSAIKGKWVKITPQDNDWLSSDWLDEFKGSETVTRYKNQMKIVLQEELFTVKNKLPNETVAGQRTEHFAIEIHTDKIVPVFEKLIADAKTRNESTMDLVDLLSELKKQETMDAVNRAVSNSSIEIWVDRARAQLRQIAWTFAAVPSSNERWKSKQLNTKLTVTIDKINENVAISEPAGAISYDEAERLLTGVSEGEQKLEKQKQRVREIRDGLAEHYRLLNAYPASLADLESGIARGKEECLKKEKTTNTNGNANIVSGTPNRLASLALEYVEPSKCSIGLGRINNETSFNTTDIYTGKPFGYTIVDSDYELTYTIVYYDDMSSYDTEQYVDGLNTANTEFVSKEKPVSIDDIYKKIAEEGTLDDDGDGLTNAQEKTYKTDKDKADTDDDGYPDKTEIDNGYNPNGPGTISENSSPEERDAKRVSEIRGMQSALELYYNDQGAPSYPAMSAVGPVSGLSSILAPTYMSTVPAPQRPADGDCTEEQNNYTYTPLQSGDDATLCTTAPCGWYSISLCIGSDMSGLSAGPLVASPSGIVSK